jgi:hypothetical protein
MRWATHRSGVDESIQNILVQKPEGKRHLRDVDVDAVILLDFKYESFGTGTNYFIIRP